MAKVKMTKDIVPNDFTFGLAVVDAIPVLFFGASMIVASMLFKSMLFLIGALMCLFAGACKVIWKVIVVFHKKNVWWLFLQMRIWMPIGFLFMIVGGIVGRNHLRGVDINIFSGSCFATSVIGMVLMGVFGFTLNSADVKSNWIEQITNGVAQIAFFIGVLIIVLSV